MKESKKKFIGSSTFRPLPNVQARMNLPSSCRKCAVEAAVAGALGLQRNHHLVRPSLNWVISMAAWGLSLTAMR